MSIKLYEGYELVGDVSDSLVVQKAWLSDLRTLMMQEQYKRAVQDVMGLAVSVIDATYVFKKPVYTAQIKSKLRISGSDKVTQIKPFTEAKSYFQHTEYEKEKYQCNLVVLRGKTKTLCLFYGKKNFRQIWEKHDCVKAYPYWDNTDRPDDVTDEEWEERFEEWKEAFAGSPSWTPLEVGWSVQLTKESLYWRLDDKAMGLIPDKESRAKEQAKSLVLDRIEKEMNTRNGKKKEQSYKQIAVYYADLLETFHSQPYQRTCLEETERIISLLPDMTIDMLIQPISLV